jgi:X-Pro dipeptidyl-peptidase
VTVDTKNSKVTLPVTDAATTVGASGAFVPDTTAPTMSPVPANMSLTTTDPTGLVVTYTPPTATDTQDPNPTVTCTPASGTKFKVGTTTVTCTATDANGNSSPSQSFTVLVTDINQTTGTVGGSVPAQLALTLGTPATFPAFIPGVGKDYLASTTATVVSTAGDASLTVADPSSTATGHLVNGTFSLPQALQAKASSALGTGTDYAPVGGSSAPTMLLGYSNPASNDTVTIGFKQTIGTNDALRTGTYSKTLTFTLSTTTP